MIFCSFFYNVFYSFSGLFSYKMIYFIYGLNLQKSNNAHCLIDFSLIYQYIIFPSFITYDTYTQIYDTSKQRKQISIKKKNCCFIIAPLTMEHYLSYYQLVSLCRSLLLRASRELVYIHFFISDYYILFYFHILFVFFFITNQITLYFKLNRYYFKCSNFIFIFDITCFRHHC